MQLGSLPLIRLAATIALLSTKRVNAAPAFNLPTKDGQYTDSVDTMNAAITCPTGITQAPKGIVLLVPGTALNGKDSYAVGPFVDLLPKEGFDVCWVSPPNQQLGDSQTNGEYVANAIINLAPQSKTGKVKVLGHSQGGGLSIPWATIFFPTARNLVDSFVGLAADFHGTTLLPYPACAAEKILSLGAGCSPSILQQEKGSMFLEAQLHYLTQQIVPTTSVFTRTDEIVIPEFGPNPSSALPGSVQFPLQDYCSVAELSDHLSIIANPAAYAIALNAFNSPTGQADLSQFNVLTDCFNISNSDLNLNDVAASIKYFASIGVSVVTSGGAYTQGEPALKQYVCDAGAATTCGVEGPSPPLLDLPEALSAYDISTSTPTLASRDEPLPGLQNLTTALDTIPALQNIPGDVESIISAVL